MTVCVCVWGGGGGGVLCVPRVEGEGDLDLELLFFPWSGDEGGVALGITASCTYNRESIE